MSKAILPVGYIAIFAALAAPVNAQTDIQEPVPVVLEEVLVTAQKRTQILQDVPISNQCGNRSRHRGYQRLLFQ